MSGGQTTDYGQHEMLEPQQTSCKAVASLVLGLLSFVLACLAGIPAIILGIMALNEISGSRDRLKGQGLAIAGLVAGCLGTVLTFILPVLLGLLLPAVQAARMAAREAESMNKLKQIGAALLTHHDARGHLPAAGSQVPGAAAGLALSWRVHLLPYLDQQPLYDQFHLDEPWDSAHNMSLVSQMPEVYHSPNFSLDPGFTAYLAVRGLEGEDPYRSGQPVFAVDAFQCRFADITDGLTSTIMVVEADASEAVVWTRPLDWQLDTALPRRGLDSANRRGFSALFADGSVSRIPSDYPDDQLVRLMLRNDNQPVNRP